MIVNKSKAPRKGVYQKPTPKYVPDDIVGKSAIKKDTIVNGILSEGNQLTLLGTLVEQIGDKIGLDTPEFAYAKAEFAKIKAVLNES